YFYRRQVGPPNQYSGILFIPGSLTPTVDPQNDTATAIEAHSGTTLSTLLLRSGASIGSGVGPWAPHSSSLALTGSSRGNVPASISMTGHLTIGSVPPAPGGTSYSYESLRLLGPSAATGVTLSFQVGTSNVNQVIQ